MCTLPGDQSQTIQHRVGQIDMQCMPLAKVSKNAQDNLRSELELHEAQMTDNTNAHVHVAS